MKTVSLREAQDRLDELAQDVEQGETVTVTRDGKPVFDLVPHTEVAEPAEKKGGIDWEAGQAYLRSKGIINPVPYIAEDFDDPLPEDFLITPLPKS
ncbi:type II toxin-antitoxin system Phd/YefM family antitoxin [Neorhizobium galegae]|uniref:Prevent-host-death family protein n=1 Tax=Neorhizobium galegae bv. officinalis TaxID=323656 RepID=A0A0T7GHU1_NEOGA|nr:type II toxin-antitoxin system prevent-host-death family antitoxin [Neorhizobium galegae]CDZ46855.1 Prevent-host-death family protein [Neorhizobium galegae bv. officinalis]